MSSKWSDNLKCFDNLDIETPCCKSKTSLNDLVYHSNACFALCAIEVEDATRELTRAEFQRLEHELGCALREVWARY